MAIIEVSLILVHAANVWRLTLMVGYVRRHNSYFTFRVLSHRYGMWLYAYTLRSGSTDISDVFMCWIERPVYTFRHLLAEESVGKQSVCNFLMPVTISFGQSSAGSSKSDISESPISERANRSYCRVDCLHLLCTYVYDRDREEVKSISNTEKYEKVDFININGSVSAWDCTTIKRAGNQEVATIVLWLLCLDLSV